MRIDFNVLWVDDQPDRLDALTEAIRRRMLVQGFLLNATTCRTLGDVKAAIADHIFTDEVDLILVDWDLGANVHGQDAIAEIRRAVPYKDVVFYSANPRELRRLACEAELEGVYCASRDNLVQEVVGVFESLVRKVLDLDHSRGIVMGATCDIDHTVIQCLKAIHEQLDSVGRTSLINEMMEHVKRHAKETAKEAAALADRPTLEAILDKNNLFTSNDRLRVLASALGNPHFAALLRYRKSVKKYIEDVVPGRNILAHVKRDGSPSRLTDQHGAEITMDRVRELRRLILDLREEFRDLLTCLQPPQHLAAGVTGPVT